MPVDVMDEYSANGKKVMVNGMSTTDNEITIECGEDFQEEMEILAFNQ